MQTILGPDCTSNYVQNMRTFRLLTAALLVLSALAFTQPASAEYESTPQTSWGVETKGNSNTIQEWAALAWEIDQVGSTVFIGGNYLDVTNGVRTERQPYLAAFESDTGEWKPSFRPAVGGPVFALEPTADGGLLVGGELRTWNGRTLGGLAKIDPTTGDLWPGFQTRVFGGNTTVRDIKIEEDGRAYAIGEFSRANDGASPATVSGVIRFDPISGTIDRSWTPDLAGGQGWGIDRSPNRNSVYLAGYFQTVNGESGTRGFAEIDDNGNVVRGRSIVPFNGCTSSRAYCSYMFDVEVTEQGHIWVGGVEHALYVIDEQSGDLVWQHYSACNPNLNDCGGRDWFGGDWQEIYRDGDRIYASCHCWFDLYTDDKRIDHVNPTGTRESIRSTAAFDVNTGLVIPTFKPDLRGDAGGFGLFVSPTDSCMWMAGGYTSTRLPDGRFTPTRDVVRICDPDTRPPNGSVTSCEARTQANGTIRLEWNEAPGTLRYIVRRSVDGSPNYWRARVSPGGGASASYVDDLITPGRAYTFLIEAVANNGTVQSPVTCLPAPIGVDPGEVIPAASCTLQTGTTANQVNWTRAAGAPANDAIVFRSKNGGAFGWRARTGGTSLNDTRIERQASYAYRVVMVAADGTRSNPTPCT